MDYKDFIAAVSGLSSMGERKVANLYQQGGMVKMMDKVILPFIVFPTGQDTRGWRIHDDFMAFMAEFGQFISEKSDTVYVILAEIAMQRLSHGAVLHEPTLILEALPPKYRKYSVVDDQRGLMTQACWDFYQKNAVMMLGNLRLHDHAAKICLGIITHCDEYGNGIDYNWGLNMKTSLKDAKNFCIDNLCKYCTIETIDQINADNWQHFLPFLQDAWNLINWDQFYQNVGASGIFRVRRRQKIKKIIFGI